MTIPRNELSEEVEVLRQFSLDLLSSIQHLRWVGLGLLALYGVNLISILLPFRFLDPAWELQFIGQLIDITPLALIGLALVLHGKQYVRTPRSLMLVRVLSWLAFLLGLGMFFLLPLSLVDSWRIQTKQQQQIQQVLSQRLDQIRTAKNQIQATDSESQLLAFVQQFNAQYPDLSIDTNQSSSNIKQQLNTLAQRASSMSKVQAQDAINTQNMALFQNGFKLCLGSLISSVWLISLFNASSWARKKAR